MYICIYVYMYIYIYSLCDLLVDPHLPFGQPWAIVIYKTVTMCSKLMGGFLFM